MSKKNIIRKRLLYRRRKNTPKTIADDQKGLKWSMQKIRSGCCSINSIDYTINMGMPTINQVIYPFSSARIYFGWRIDDLPQKSNMHMIPDSYLLTLGLLSFPHIIDNTMLGREFSQTIYNMNSYPIRIKKQTLTQTYIYKLCPKTLAPKQMLKIDFGQILSGVLGVAQQVLPFFI